MELYVVRHGQTDWNKAHKIQGRANRSINLEGIEQIEKTAKKLTEIDFDSVYVSPLERAVQTAKILRGDEEFVLDDRIIEIGFGKLEGEIYKGIKEKKPEEFSDVEKRIVDFFKFPDQYEPVEGGETYQSMLGRIDEFIEDLENKHKNEEKILVVSHATVIHGILMKALDRPLKEIWDVDVPNGGVTKLSVNNGKISLAGKAAANTEF